MRVRWFGESWGAPVCDPLFHVPVDVVVGSKCVECKGVITERDHGVVTACSIGVWGSWRLEVTENVDDELDEVGWWPVCSYHLHCFLGVVVGGVPEPHVRNREFGAHRIVDPVGPAEFTPEQTSDPGVTEEAEPGRGWGSESP